VCVGYLPGMSDENEKPDSPPTPGEAAAPQHLHPSHDVTQDPPSTDEAGRFPPSEVAENPEQPGSSEATQSPDSEAPSELTRSPGLSTPGSGYTPGGLRRPIVKPILVRPRKVRGGVKLPNGDVAPPTAWVAQRWLRLIEQAAVGARLVEGLEDYARAGQTKKIGYLVSRVDAIIQGRADRPYATSIAFDAFSPETWDKVVETMAEGALYAAKLLASELPPNIEDVFAPLGLKLFPVDNSEVKHSCSCFDWRTENGGNPNIMSKGKWCKHVCCLAYLLAHRLASEPFLVFLLRGIEGSELLERLRQRRAVAGAVMGSTPIYSQRIPGAAEFEPPTLEESLDQFWDAGPALAEIDLPLTPPPMSHPLLRRLGQSPFLTAQFPLVGLLASCYDTVSDQTLEANQLPPVDESEDPSDEMSQLRRLGTDAGAGAARREERGSQGENQFNDADNGDDESELDKAALAAQAPSPSPNSPPPPRVPGRAAALPIKAAPLPVKAAPLPPKAAPLPTPPPPAPAKAQTVKAQTVKAQTAKAQPLLPNRAQSIPTGPAKSTAPSKPSGPNKPSGGGKGK
jgi:uncharacterized Zn finger protein